MPKMTLAVATAIAALMSAGTALAQQQPAPARPAPTSPAAQPAIQSVNIVDMTELPKETQQKVNDVIAKRSDADLQKLRSSIDAAPPIKQALEAKGLTSKQVVAASLSKDGSLTLITKKPG
ncbi:MAG: hypothetical protein ABWZ57_17990 [Mesorhizobium sp.]|jgi:hypothetical protein